MNFRTVVKIKKSKLGEGGGHVVQGDPMFKKAWSHGIITKIPDRSTIYFKLPKGNLKVRGNLLSKQ